MYGPEPFITVPYSSQGHREGGGQGGTMTPGPMDFRWSMGMRSPTTSACPRISETVRILVMTFFFFWRSPTFERKNRSNLSWPRAHVRLSAPLMPVVLTRLRTGPQIDGNICGINIKTA